MNLLAGANELPQALLALEDGTVLAGRACGAAGEAFGEVVFNTSMTGYQEIVTDPSYAGQLVTFTYPQIGNYGVTAGDNQGVRPALAGVIVHDMCHTPSNWQSVTSLPDYLAEKNIVAIEGVDTRALTLRIREKGAMRAAISTVDLDAQSLLARVRQSAPIADHNFVADVSTAEAFEVAPADQSLTKAHVVAYDCGEKNGILDRLVAVGCKVTAVPWNTPAQTVLDMDPDGVFFSNGPGDPRELPELADAARKILGRVPTFGICLGNQVLSMAAGAQIEKLPFGHHGGNEPVMNLLTGRVEITAQNHNYGLVFSSMGPLVSELSCGATEHVDDLRHWARAKVAPVVQTERFGRVRLTHVNLNDGTPEGIQFLDVPAFSLQYHPEAKPGPSDSAYAFDAFARLIAAGESWGECDYLAIDVREGRRF